MNKENIVLTDEEKMKKRFGLFRKIISWAEAGCIAMPIVAIGLVLIFGVILGIEVLVGGENLQDVLENAKIELFNFENDYSEISSNSYDNEKNINNDVDAKEYDIGNSAFFGFYNYNVSFKTKSPIIAKVFKICEICDYIITVFILDYLKKIFGEIAEKGTPFTEYNIQYKIFR